MQFQYIYRIYKWYTATSSIEFFIALYYKNFNKKNLQKCKKGESSIHLCTPLVGAYDNKLINKYVLKHKVT